MILGSSRKFWSLAILALSLVIAFVIYQNSPPVIAANSNFIEKTGEGFIAPACGSSSNSAPTCVANAPSVTIDWQPSWTYVNEFGNDVTVTNGSWDDNGPACGGAAQCTSVKIEANGQIIATGLPCTGSYTWDNSSSIPPLSVTSYSYEVRFSTYEVEMWRTTESGCDVFLGTGVVDNSTVVGAGHLINGSSFTTPICPAFDYTLTNEAGQNGIINVPPNSGRSVNVSAALISGVAQQLTFGVVGGLPAGITLQSPINPCTPNPNCSSDVAMLIDGAVIPGDYPITVSAFPGGKTTTFILRVNVAPNSLPSADARVGLAAALATTKTVDVTKDEFTTLYFNASNSGDADGWSDVTNGGRCDWNNDLWGTWPPSAFLTMNNPASPASCNFNQIYQFNDNLGGATVITKTYQILQITDGRGGQSSVDSINVRIHSACSDGKDNDDPEDTLADAADPGCHVGGIITNPFDPTITSENNTPNNNPVVNAGIDKTVNENSTVLFSDATASDPDGDSLTYSWSCNGGTLSSASVLNPTYTAPFVGADTTFVCSLTVTDGKGGSAVSSVNVLVKDVPAFNYTISASNVTVPSTGSGASTVSTTLSSGTTQPVNFSVSGLPAGASPTFSPSNSCSPPCSRTLNITTTGVTPETYPITVTGTSAGTPNKTATFTLTVNPSDYNLSASPLSLFATVSGSGSVTTSKTTVSVVPIGTFTENVTLKVVSINPVIPGAVVHFGNPTIDYNSPTTFWITVPASTAEGTYTITLCGNDGAVQPSDHCVFPSMSLVIKIRDPNFKEVIRRILELFAYAK